MPCEGRLARHHRSADGTEPVLWSQDCGATWCRRVPGQVPVTGLDVRLPGGIKWSGVPRHLHRTLRFDGRLSAEDLRAGVWIGAPPRRPPILGPVAGGDPASGLVRVAPCGPSAQPPPNEALALGEGGATDHGAVIVRPASQDRGAGADERCWRAARTLLAEDRDLGVDGLETGLAGGNLPLGRFPLGPLVLAPGLPSAVNALCDLGDDRFRR